MYFPVLHNNTENVFHKRKKEEKTYNAADVNEWMKKNKLNEEKTELLVVGDRTRLCQVKNESLTFSPNAVPFQTSAKTWVSILMKHCP